MDDLGNILYLVLIIGFSLIGFFKSKNKAQEEKTVVANEIDEESVAEILRKLTRQEQIAPPQTKRKDKKQSLKKQEKLINPLRKHEAKNDRSIDEIYENNVSQEFSLESLDDARRAFVYSEIFQRKY